MKIYLVARLNGDLLVDGGTTRAYIQEIYAEGEQFLRK